MSYLPIILIVVFLLSRNGKGLSGLKDFDFESIAPLLNLFGVNDNVLKLLTGDEMKNITSDNFDIKSVLPLVTSLLENFKSTNHKPFVNEQHFAPTPEYLNPIKDVASAEILSSLGNYFN